MIKIVIGGQIDKQQIYNKLEQLGAGKFELTIKNDLEAAMAMQQKQYDYYIGACNTGGGGALAMAIALLGADNCATISMPGMIKDDAFIQEEVKKGKIAFGFTAQHTDQVLPVLVKAILEK